MIESASGLAALDGFNPQCDCFLLRWLPVQLLISCVARKLHADVCKENSYICPFSLSLFLSGEDYSAG